MQSRKTSRTPCMVDAAGSASRSIPSPKVSFLFLSDSSPVLNGIEAFCPSPQGPRPSPQPTLTGNPRTRRHWLYQTPQGITPGCKDPWEPAGGSMPSTKQPTALAGLNVLQDKRKLASRKKCVRFALP